MVGDDTIVYPKTRNIKLLKIGYKQLIIHRQHRQAILEIVSLYLFKVIEIQRVCLFGILREKYMVETFVTAKVANA